MLQNRILLSLLALGQILVSGCQSDDPSNPPQNSSFLVQREYDGITDTVFYFELNFLNRIKQFQRDNKKYTVSYDSLGNIDAVHLGDSIVGEFQYFDDRLEGSFEPGFLGIPVMRILHLDSLGRVTKITRGPLGNPSHEVNFAYNPQGNLFKASSSGAFGLGLHPEKYFSRISGSMSSSNPFADLPLAIKYYLETALGVGTEFLFMNCYSRNLLDSTENRIAAPLNPGESTGFRRKTIQYEFNAKGWPTKATERIQDLRYVYPDSLNLSLDLEAQAIWTFSYSNYNP